MVLTSGNKTYKLEGIDLNKIADKAFNNKIKEYNYIIDQKSINEMKNKYKIAKNTFEKTFIGLGRSEGDDKKYLMFFYSKVKKPVKTLLNTDIKTQNKGYFKISKYRIDYIKDEE
jgi:hypothetical protein